MRNRSLILVILMTNPAIGVMLFFNDSHSLVSITLLLINTVMIFVLYTCSTRFIRSFSNKLGLSGAKLLHQQTLDYAQRCGIFMDEARQAISSIQQIGQPEFTLLLDRLQEEEIKAPLKKTNAKIIDIRTKDHQNNWITNGIAALSELQHNENDLSGFCYNLLAQLIKYINANQGAFFLLHSNEDGEWLELVACYAYDKVRYQSKKIYPGDGLVGQVYYEKEVVYLTNLPKDYIKITSGLGETTPGAVCIVPLIIEDKVIGVIEIASLNALAPFEIQFLQKSAEGIAYSVSSIKTHSNTEKLLKDSQRMAEEVRRQEEELRLRMIELTNAQEQMKRKQTEIDTVLASLSTVELDIDGFITDANPVFLGITGYALNNIKGREYKSLIPQHGNDPIQYEIMWSSIMRGRSFSGEFRIVNNLNMEMWMAGSFTPIFNQLGSPYKVMVISLFTTQDKEKLMELQETITAFKHCFPVAEFNGDMTFKSANDLFLAALGVKRVELKALQAKNVLANGSFGKIEQFLTGTSTQPNHTELELQHADGGRTKFKSTLVAIQSTNRKKGLVILQSKI